MIMQCFPHHGLVYLSNHDGEGWAGTAFFTTDLRLIDSVRLTVLNIDSQLGKLVECN